MTTNNSTNVSVNVSGDQVTVQIAGPLGVQLLPLDQASKMAQLLNEAVSQGIAIAAAVTSKKPTALKAVEDREGN